MPADAVPPDFDVAFSFLARDEELALELARSVQGSAGAFVYSERQKDLAGTDGVGGGAVGAVPPKVNYAHSRGRTSATQELTSRPASGSGRLVFSGMAGHLLHKMKVCVPGGFVL